MSDRPKCTVGELARFADVGVNWLIARTDSGQIECERRVNGRRMYDPIEAPKQVQEIIDGNGR